jgi:long-subunit acyl-CoA synthetase (AMP-forming)
MSARGTSSTADAARPAVDAQPSLCAAFQATVQERGDAPALRTPASSQAISWREYAGRARTVAGGLAALGVGPGDPVALLLRNTTEFHILDTGALHLRAIPFSIYVEEPVERIVALLRSSGARVAITEPHLVERLAGPARDAGVEHLVAAGDPVLEAPAPAGVDIDALWRAATPEDVCTIVYTSGTTGAPKGVELTHRNILFAAENVHRIAPVRAGVRTLTYLPNSHLAERFMTHYMGMCFGYDLTCVADPSVLYDAIREARPTRFFGVPRIWEKLLADARGAIAADPALTEEFERSLAEVEAVQATGGGPAADVPALAAVREHLGFGEADWLGTAAAPSSRDVIAAFLAMGLPLADIWGLTECLMTTMNPPERVRLGTVGRPFPGVEVRLGDDDEIMVRGDNVYRGYRGDPERTREVLDEDGWLRTGDIGRIDEDGYVAIVGRAKEMIINAAGLNISPVTIEQAISAESDLIEHIAVIGDGRRYITALIVVDPGALAEFAARNDLDGTHEQLVATDEVQAELDRAVATGNQRLAPPERVRRWTAVADRWTTDAELTSLMKLKRPVIAERYAAAIEAMYI